MVTQCGALIKAKLDPLAGSECVIEKKWEWLHNFGEETKVGAKEYNPFDSNAEDDVIEEYFAVEDKKQATAVSTASATTTKLEEKKMGGMESAAAEGLEPPAKTEDKSKKKGDLAEWLLVD